MKMQIYLQLAFVLWHKSSAEEIGNVKLLVKQGKMTPQNATLKGWISVKNITLRNTSADCDRKDLYYEARHLFNFKRKFSGMFYIKCMKNYTGSVEIFYSVLPKEEERCTKCVSTEQSCFLTSEGNKCECLLKPDQRTEWDSSCSGAKYIGCVQAIPLLSTGVHLNSSELLSPKMCIKSCEMMGYKHALLMGVENGCVCTQKEMTGLVVLDEGHCVSACKYDSSFSCGNYPYAHVYQTGVKPNLCSQSSCPNGTYCLQVYDSYHCVCNRTAKHQNCYGCLEGWDTFPNSSTCYKIKDIAKPASYAAQKCSAIYGNDLQLTSTSQLLVTLRMLLQKFIDNPSQQRDVDRLVVQLDHQQATFINLPVCERHKFPVSGRYPWSVWPDGTYGLPMPEHGCPDAHRFEWKAGFYLQDTEQTENKNNASQSLHLYGEVTKDHIKQGYCMKTNNESKKSESLVHQWPKGQYCVYKKGACPNGMVEADLFWDDEDSHNKNKVEGEVPDGMFKKDTDIWFCCNEHPLVEEGIVLPRDKAFYLFPYKHKRCQPVVGTESTLEFIQFDIENYFGELSALIARGDRYPYVEIDLHIKLFYCYYEPVKSCGPPMFASQHKHTKGEKYLVGYRLYYTCESGYINAGDKWDTCLPSEQWSSLTGPFCQDKNECLLGHTCHVKANCENTLGSYKCTCNRGWVGDGHTCKVATCDRPDPPEHAVFTEALDPHTQVYFPHTKLHFKCDHGYHLIGLNTTMCLENEQWSPVGYCREKTRCVENTYYCIAYTLDGTVSANCFCEEMLTEPKHPGNNVTAAKNAITAVASGESVSLTMASLAIFSISFVVSVFLLIKWKQRANGVERDFSVQTNASIYADIEEFNVDVELGHHRGVEGAPKMVALRSRSAFHPKKRPILPPRSHTNPSIHKRNSLANVLVDNHMKSRKASEINKVFLVRPITVTNKMPFPAQQYNGRFSAEENRDNPIVNVHSVDDSDNESNLDKGISSHHENPYIDINFSSTSSETSDSVTYNRLPSSTRCSGGYRSRSYTVGYSREISRPSLCREFSRSVDDLGSDFVVSREEIDHHRESVSADENSRFLLKDSLDVKNTTTGTTTSERFSFRLKFERLFSSARGGGGHRKQVAYCGRMRSDTARF